MIVEATSEVAMVAGRQAVSTQVPELYYIQVVMKKKRRLEKNKSLLHTGR